MDYNRPTVNPPPSDDAPIFLIGFMGSGKTTVGRLLADRLGWAFADLDERIAGLAGTTIPEIFAREGEPAFRRREAEALARAAAERRVVLATGGGAACNDANLTLMLKAGHVAALVVSPAEAVRRAGAVSGRPLLDGAADPVTAAATLLAARQPFYDRAHWRVETEGRPPAQVADEIATLVASRAGRRRESA